MKLSHLLRMGDIVIVAGSPSKGDVIRQLVQRAIERHEDLAPEVRDALLPGIEAREDKGSTGMENGVAFPHARIQGLEQAIAVFGVAAGGIAFGSVDGLPARFLCLLLVPASRPELGVKLQSVLARFLGDEQIREALGEADTSETIHALIMQANIEIDSPIIALDLIRDTRLILRKDTPLREATHLMCRRKAIAAPVVEDDGTVIGELSCTALFERELPDYLKHLHSVPGISDFNLFRDYFTADASRTVGDVMNRECAVVDERTTLLEVVFLLSVKRHPAVYVCRNGRLLGVVDQITVLDRVINF